VHARLPVLQGLRKGGVASHGLSTALSVPRVLLPLPWPEGAEIHIFFLARLLRRLQVRHSRVGGRVAVSRRVVSGRPCGALHAGSGFVTAGLPVLKWSCLLLSCGMWRGSRIARSACACCVRQGRRARTSALGVRLRGNYVRLRGDCRRMRVESRSQLVARPKISSEVPHRYSDQQEAEMHGSRAIGAGFPISI